MHALIYLKSSKKLLAEVELEVCPRGIYTINGVEYILKEQPNFFIDDDYFTIIQDDPFGQAIEESHLKPLKKLTKVELYVEKVEDPSKDDTL